MPITSTGRSASASAATGPRTRRSNARRRSRVREAAPDCRWLASVATDAPFLPHDMVARLLGAVAREGADMACAASAGRNHPVFGLWPLRLTDDLARAVRDEGLRKVDAWTARHRLAVAPFPDTPIDPFFNANRPDDLAAAEEMLARLGADPAPA